jgi:hypothetical protein
MKEKFNWRKRCEINRSKIRIKGRKIKRKKKMNLISYLLKK